MTSLSLTFSIFKTSLQSLQFMCAHLINTLDAFKRMRSNVTDAEAHLKYVREQERNEAVDLYHF